MYFKRSAGYTMIEIIVTVTIAAAIAGVAAVKWKSGSDYQYNAVARKMVADIKYVQNYCQKNGTTGTIYFVNQPVSGTSGGRCFIATAAYGSTWEPHVVAFRKFRETVLRRTPPGRAFIQLYTTYGPKAADFILENPSLKPVVRFALTPFAVFFEGLFGTPAYASDREGGDGGHDGDDDDQGEKEDDDGEHHDGEKDDDDEHNGEHDGEHDDDEHDGDKDDDDEHDDDGEEGSGGAGFGGAGSGGAGSGASGISGTPNSYYARAGGGYIKDPGTNQDFIVQLPSEIAITSSTIAVTFSSDGRPDPSLFTAGANRAIVVLNNGKRTIYLAPVTGDCWYQ